MEFIGRVFQVGELQTGFSSKSNKEWNKRQVVFTTSEESQFPKKVAVDFMNNAATENFMEGSVYNVHFDLESREYNGKWYSSIRGFKVELDPVSLQNNQPTQQQTVQQPVQAVQQQQQQPVNNVSSDDNLPF
ncbi:MAG: DUF3127 domain-containing protein [Bacteroidales bacterium]